MKRAVWFLILILSVAPALAAQQTESPVVLRNAPSVTPETHAGVEAGAWVWDRSAILASPALTLADLLGEIPGIVLVRGGDLGAPVGVSAFGQGAGQIRVFLDGIEELPVEGGGIDLSGVPMVGLEEIRVERSIAELRIHLRSHVADDPDPYTLLDVGTGDLRTNLFRVAFVHPQVAGGSLLVALDRADTDGPAGAERGALYGTRFQYSLFPRETVSATLGYRSRTARRPGRGLYLPEEVNHNELRARLGWQPSETLRAQVHALRVTASLAEERATAADSLLLGAARIGAGATVQWADGPFRAWGSGAWQDGEGWARDRVEAGLQVSRPDLGGVMVRWDREGWDEITQAGRDAEGDPVRDAAALGELPGTGGWSVQGWTAPLLGLSLFAQMDHATRGVPFVVGPDLERSVPGGEGEEDEVIFEPRAFAPLKITGREGLRAGARFSSPWLDLTGAWFRVQADSLAPLGLALDRSGRWAPGGEGTGFEVMGTLSLEPVLRGLSLTGSGTFWDLAEEAEGALAGPSLWAYLPERAWVGRLTWYRTGYEGKLETWMDVGVRGRDGMLTSQSLQAGVPREVGFSQNWYTRLQVRVATVRIFVHWDNVAFRESNADLPDRFLPQTRAVYGIRWTMRN
jgi:hypothetical protein